MPPFKLPVHRVSDRDLVAAAAHGDAEAFAAFYRRYRDLVLAYAVRRLPTPELAADLMMETFAAALVSLRRRGAQLPDHPAAWLFGIARNKLIDAYRRGANDDEARRRLELEPMVLDDEDLARIDVLSDDDRVNRLLRALPRAQREAVRARIVEDRGYDEIAGALRTSEMVVRKRVSRGLSQLRTSLEDES
jgi:RNA polymerase sigma factor (sigma-70 family)